MKELGLTSALTWRGRRDARVHLAAESLALPGDERRGLDFLERGLRLTAAGILWLVAGCSSYPVHDEAKACLKHLAEAYKQRSPDEVLEYYAEDFALVDGLAQAESEAREELGVRTRRFPGTLDRAAYGAVLATWLSSFAQVERAKFILEGVEQDGERAIVDASFKLHGVKTDGVRHQEDSLHRFTLVRSGAHLIVREHRVLERSTVESSCDYFVDRTAAAGLDYAHAAYAEEDPSTPVIPNHRLGSGASAGDIDDDGDLDLVIGDGLATRLMRNEGDGTFAEITAEAGLGRVGRVRGAYLVDLDNDRQLDIFLARIQEPAKLFLNLGQNRFEDVSARAFQGISFFESTSAAFADLDSDGLLDVALSVYNDFETVGWAKPIWNAENGSLPMLLRNRGDGTFEEMKEAVAVCPPGWGLAVACADYDADGDQDVYFVNDYGDNRLLRNDGGWKLTDVTEQSGAADRGYGMGAAFGDFDGDEDLDLYVTNMFTSSRWVFSAENFPYPWIARFLFMTSWLEDQFRKVTHGNSLLENQGDGTFVEVASTVGAERADWAWGADFFDFDNDGDLDIFSPNGFISGADAADD